MKKSKYNFEKFFKGVLDPEPKPVKEGSYYERHKEDIRKQRQKKLDEKGRKYKKNINWKDPEERRKYNRAYYHQKLKAVPEVGKREALKIRTDVFEEAEIVMDPPRIVVPKPKKVPLTEEQKKQRRHEYYVANRKARLDYQNEYNREKFGERRLEKQPFKIKTWRGNPRYITLYMREYKRLHKELGIKTRDYLRRERNTLSDMYIVRLLTRGPNPVFQTKDEAWNNPEAIVERRNYILIYRIKRKIKSLTK